MGVWRGGGERERERGGREYEWCVCVCVCVCDRYNNEDKVTLFIISGTNLLHEIHPYYKPMKYNVIHELSRIP